MRSDRWLVAGCLAVCLIGLSTTTARSAIIFDFVTNQSSGNHTVLPTQSTSVDIFLRETLTAGSTSLLAAEEGMAGIGFRVARTTSPSAPASITAAAIEPAFAPPVTSITGGGAQADIQGATFGASSPIIVDSATVRRIRYGSVTIQAGAIPLQTTTFTLSDIPASGDNLTNTNLMNIDSQITNRTFTVTTIPEPTAAGLVALGGLVLLRRVRR